MADFADVRDVMEGLLAQMQPFAQRLPSYNSLASIATGLYSVASTVPYLPLFLTFLSVYVAIYTVYQTTRQFLRATSFILKYGALFGVLATGFNYLNNTPPATQPAAGRRGQSWWQSRPSRDYPQPRRNTRSSSRTTLPTESVGQMASWLFDRAIKGESIVDAVWDQVKGAVGNLAVPVQEGGSRKRSRRSR